MKIKNKDVIQSYLLTSARYDFDVYEKRILFRLVELCQPEISDKKLNEKFSINPDLFGNQDIKVPISYLLKDEDDKNHTRIKNAILRLNEKHFEYEDDKVWKPIRLIEMPKIDKYNEFIEFKIHAEIHQAILDFSKGFRRFELTTAMGFKSTYSMRFYELFSEKKAPITYSIEHLKIMFKIEEKYSRINDFIRFVIESAKKELDKSSPYSFEYTLIKEGRKVTAIKFHPYFIPENRDEKLETKKLQKQVSPHWDLDKMTIDYLKQNYLFTTDEIQRNVELFKEAENKLDLMLLMAEKQRICDEKRSPKAYLIGIINKQLAKKYSEYQLKN